MRRLFDVNVLVALCDRAHPHHAAATKLLGDSEDSGWASCPLTENGLIRILTNRSYPGGPRRPGDVIGMLSRMRAQNHRFVPDDLSLTETTRFVFDRLQGAAQLTDIYLLALAVKHRMRFVTFDGRVNPAIVIGGDRALETIPLA